MKRLSVLGVTLGVVLLISMLVVQPAKAAVGDCWDIDIRAEYKIYGFWPTGIFSHVRGYIRHWSANLYWADTSDWDVAIADAAGIEIRVYDPNAVVSMVEVVGKPWEWAQEGIINNDGIDDINIWVTQHIGSILIEITWVSPDSLSRGFSNVKVYLDINTVTNPTTFHEQTWVLNLGFDQPEYASAGWHTL